MVEMWVISLARNCCVARTLPRVGAGKTFERSNGLDTMLYKNIPFFCSWDDFNRGVWWLSGRIAESKSSEHGFEYVAMDSVGNMRVVILCVVIAAWLNVSQRRLVGFRLDASARGWSVNRFERSNRRFNYSRLGQNELVMIGLARNGQSRVSREHRCIRQRLS